MDYELLQDAFVARLQPLSVAGITSVRLPESEAERAKNLPGKVQLTVIYAGSEYGPVNSTGQVSQDEKIFMQILIESSFLYGPLGIYSMVKLLKLAFSGFKTQGTREFQVSKHHTIGPPEAVKKDNMWEYQIIFQASAGVAVQFFEEDITVLLKKITLLDKPGDEPTVIPPQTL